MLHSRLFLPRRRVARPEAPRKGVAVSDRGKELIGNVVSYEVLLLLDPELPDERQNEILTRMRERIERAGSWSRHEPWGRRKLAYEIDHKGEGVYHLVTFETAPETLEEVSRVLRITDGVMRHLAVRLPERAGERGERPARAPAADPTGAASVGTSE